MALCTLSALLLATPFCCQLLELTIRLLPLIQKTGALIVRFRKSTPTPETTQQFERELFDLLRQTGREIVDWVYNHLEPDQWHMPAQICFQGNWYRWRKKSCNRSIATLFGTMRLWRYRYESLERGLCSIFPLEINLGIVAGRATPALAERAGQAAVDHTQKMSRLLLQRDHNVHWASKTYRRVIAALSAGMAEFRHECQVTQVLGWLQQAFASQGRHQPTLVAGRDGIFLPMRQDKKYREGAAATVSVLDRRGKRVGTVYLGRMPEAGQGTLSTQLTELFRAIVTQWPGPLPRLQYVTDAGDHQTDYFQDVLRRMRHPCSGKRLCWEWVVDFFHASSYVSKMAEALFEDAAQAQSWAHKMRRWLRDKPHGIYRVLHSAAALRLRRTLSDDKGLAYRKAYDYLRKRMQFLDYADCRRRGLAIGSGITEAACKILFAQRLKRSGMKWTVAGGQVILDLRVLQLSGIWAKVHQAYLAAQPRLELPTTGTQRASRRKTMKIAA